MVYQPKEIPEGINVTSVHPLVNFAYLLITVIIISGLGYLGLGAIASSLATHISPKLEIKIGQQLISQIDTQNQDANSQQQRYLEDLLASLEQFNSENYLPLTIHLQNSEYHNAAILPGGHILITTGLLAAAKSENELAFILAHELGHHLAKDPLKGLGRSLVFLTVTNLLGLGSVNANLIGITGSLTNLHYSRQQESIADVYALSTIMQRYGHGEGSLDFFYRLQTETENHRGQLKAYFSTHPLTQQRINHLHQVAQQQNWSMKGNITRLPSGIWQSDHDKAE